MINFEEELKKFKPSLEIDQAEEAIYKNDLRDVTDILEDMMKEVKIASGKCLCMPTLRSCGQGGQEDHIFIQLAL